MSPDSEATTAVTGDSTSFVKAMTSAQASLHMLGSTLSNMGGIMGSVGSVVQGFAGAGVMGAVSAVVNEVIEGLQDALRSYMDFETALINVASASGLAGEELAQLTEDVQAAAMAAGVEFGVGATEATKAMEALVKAGMQGEEAVTALGAALALAKVEGMNTAEASNLLVGILGMYGMAAEEAAHATDVLVNASIAGVGTASEFARGLSYVGGRASQLGFSLEETTAALVALNNQGIQATTAGQSLNMMLTQLVQKSDNLGFSLYDSQGNMLSLGEIMGNLTDKLNSMATQEERNTYLTEMFGARAGRAAAALLNMGDSGDDVTKALLAMTKGVTQGGTALDIVAQKTDTLAGTQARLDAMFENLSITLGESLAPMMEWVADIMEDYLIPMIEGVLPPIMAFIDAIFQAVKFLFDLGKVIANYLKPIIDGIMFVLRPFIEGIKFLIDVIMAFLGGVAAAVSDAAEAIDEANQIIEDSTEQTADAIVEATEEEIAQYERLGSMYQQYADSRMGIDREIVESTEDAVDGIIDALDELQDGTQQAWDSVVDTATSAIEQGLLGDAQDAIHAFVDCSLGKQADMVEDIDGYMKDISDTYLENSKKINELLAQGRYEEANMLTRQNEELMKKLEQLMIWRTQLVDQTWADTTDTVKQALLDQYGLMETYYGDVEDLLKPIVTDPIIEPIDGMLDPIRGVDPIMMPTPEPISQTLASINMEFTGDYTPQDAKALAEEVYEELRKIDEEKMTQRWMTRIG